MSLLLLDGVVVDGTGAPARRADVRLVDGHIAEVAPGLQVHAGETVLRLDGAVVAPGFVDVHTHSDLSRSVYPDAISRTSQGITTEVVGNCGMSPFPMTDAAAHAEATSLLDVTVGAADGGPTGFADAASYLDAVDAHPAAVNTVVLIGHGSLRAAHLAGVGREPSADQLATLRRVVHEALDAGAAGVSLGLMYAPGEMAGPLELGAVAEAVSDRDGVLAAHLRDYTPAGLVAAMDELLAASAPTGVRLQISHLRAAGDRHTPRLVAALARLDAAPPEVVADAYPYTAGHTTLLQLLTPVLRQRGARWCASLARSDRAAVVEALAATPFAPGDIVVARAGRDPGPLGRSLAELGEDPGATGPWAAAAALIAAHDGEVDVIIEGAHPDDARAALTHPRVLVGSDGFALDPDHLATGVHPRSFGTFPRALRWLMEAGMELPDVVAKLSAAPAARFRLSERGTLAPGRAADLVVLDLGTLADRATPADPRAVSRGVRWTIVNGEVVWHDGRASGARPGRLLRRRRDGHVR